MSLLDVAQAIIVNTYSKYIYVCSNYHGYEIFMYHLWLSSRSFAPMADIGEIGPEPGGRAPVFCMVLMISRTSFMSVSSSFRSSSKPAH